MKEGQLSHIIPIVAFALTILLFTSCKKYEEGPALSLRSKKSRLANTWQRERKLVNGSEVALNTTDQSYRLTLKKNGDAKELNEDVFLQEEGMGKWSLESDKEQLKIFVKFSEDVHRTTVYTIVRLKEKELWLSEMLNDGKVVEYRLVPGF